MTTRQGVYASGTSCCQCHLCACTSTMSSSDSKRTRDQTSPTGYTPYTASKRSTRETPRERGEGESQDLQVQHRSVRKSLFQQWRKGEEKLLVTYVSLHCLELNSGWPKYQPSHPTWEEASRFLSQHLL